MSFTICHVASQTTVVLQKKVEIAYFANNLILYQNLQLAIVDSSHATRRNQKESRSAEFARIRCGTQSQTILEAVPPCFACVVADKESLITSYTHRLA